MIVLFPDAPTGKRVTRPFCPPAEDPLRLGLLQDPFGLRKAIVPVFLQTPDGEWIGVGTAFQMDGWGNLLTADHVVDMMRQHRPPLFKGGLQDLTLEFSDGDVHPYVLFGIGLAFGTVGTPPGAVEMVKRVETRLREHDDPLANMRGETSAKPVVDIAILRTGQPETKYVASLAIRLTGTPPKPGEWVYAVGYPELDCSPLDRTRMMMTLREGMHGSYGRVVNVHPQGASVTNPTPVFEVEANWPGGMSGGPVFNQQGEVIGLVSRSIEASSGDAAGTAYVAAFQLVPWLRHWLSTIDPVNPDRRMGWAVRSRETLNLDQFFQTQAEADSSIADRADSYEVVFGSKPFDLAEFMSGSSHIELGVAGPTDFTSTT